MFVPALFGLLLAASVSGQGVFIQPLEAVRRVGDNITVLCKVNYPIDSCRVTVGKVSYRLRPDEQSGEVFYAGQGLQMGECGAHIKNIREEWNGNISCVLPPQTGSIELSNSMRLIVAKAPEPPQLIVPPNSDFREGDRLLAMCVVPNGRPAAMITWYLGDKQLLEGIHQPIFEENGDLMTVRANLTRVLTADDGGKLLTCSAAHEALDIPRNDSRQLSVVYPPRADSEGTQLTIFGLKLGEEGHLTARVRSFPPPRAQWTVAGRELTAPGQVEDGTLMALEPTPLGDGFYNISLVIRRVEKADVERAYYLRVHNDQGELELTLRISTLDEPQGVDLDTGAIVGIVIAALILLLAVSLLVFAKATDRWCFAGRRDRDAAKSSGESSDTESAVGGMARGARAHVTRARAAALGAWDRVRARLPAGRDKVQASEHQPDDEKPTEKKEGVVYAELALSETGTGATREPAAPPTTEYAEIVYTDQGQKEAKE